MWNYINQKTAATSSQNMYQGNSYVESDLINSYSWDTAVIFIQKYSNDANYASKATANSSRLNTGKAGDEMLHINDMASNYREWSTEYCDFIGSSGAHTCVSRGGYYGGGVVSNRVNDQASSNAAYISFRTILYFK